MNNRRIPILASLAAMFGIDGRSPKPLTIAPAPTDMGALAHHLSLLTNGPRSGSHIPPQYFRSPGWKQKQRRKKARRLGLH